MEKQFEPKKKTADENPIAILLMFLNSQRQLVANPPKDMGIDEIIDTKVLIETVEKFIIEFNAAVYEVQTLRTKLKMVEMSNPKAQIIL